MTLPLDTHAHIEPNIAPGKLDALGACVLAVTRSLDEFAAVQARTDSAVLWAAGCHPGLATAVRDFTISALERAITATPAIGEIGLDRSSRVPVGEQVEVFEQILVAASRTPRILSIHSYRATDLVLEALERHRPTGTVLHWWLGSEAETKAALRLGAYFSINESQARKWKGIDLLPKERILFETDHPFGDRQQAPPRHPGRLSAVEERVASVIGDSPVQLRLQSWRNLNQLVEDLSIHSMLPHGFQVQLLAS